jgi:hypothetical protein
MTVSDIIALLGGSSAVARYTGWPVTTVDSWQANGHVPDWRRTKLLEMAASESKSLSTSDFPPRPAKPESAAA